MFAYSFFSPLVPNWKWSFDCWCGVYASPTGDNLRRLINSHYLGSAVELPTAITADNSVLQVLRITCMARTLSVYRLCLSVVGLRQCSFAIISFHYLATVCDVADRMSNDYFAKRNFVENVRDDVIIEKRVVPVTNVIDLMASRINRSPRLDKFGDTFFFSVRWSMMISRTMIN